MRLHRVAARLAGIAILALVAAHAVAGSAPAAELEFEVQGMTCDACARSAEAALKKVRGIKKAKVDFATKAGVVTLGDKPATLEDVRAALAGLGFETLAAGEKPDAPLSKDVVAKLDIKTVSVGERVTQSQLVVSGKVTIVDYFAEWCGPCKLLERHLERLVQAHDGKLAIRRVDIVKWGSPAERQAQDDFGLTALPMVRIFGTEGELLGTIQGNAPDVIRDIVTEALAAPKGAKS